MNTVTRLVKHVLLLVMLSASLATAQAVDRGSSVGSLESFQDGGLISSVSSSGLVAGGKQYRYNSPLTFLESSLRKSVGALKVGDQVWLQGKIINNVLYIDVISVLPADDS